MFLAVFCLTCVISQSVNAAIHVDSKSGNDEEASTLEDPVKTVVRAFEILKLGGIKPTIKLHPGLHAVEQVIRIDMLREQSSTPVVIEASILPGEEGWSPEAMPVLTPPAHQWKT